MAVSLIPVEVVLKLWEVTVRSLVPVLREDAARPERARLPEAAVRFRLPVVRVKPLEAVRVLVKVPVPVTARLAPMVSLLVTEAELKVARPEVDRVEREELPVTDRVPPRVVAPVPTVRVLVPETEVLQLRVTAPEPVLKVPVEADWSKL